TTPSSTSFPYTTLFRSSVTSSRRALQHARRTVTELKKPPFPAVSDPVTVIECHCGAGTRTPISRSRAGRLAIRRPRSPAPEFRRSEEHTSELQSPDHLV